MKTLRWGETVLSGYYSSSLSAKIEGRPHPCFGTFTSKPYSWSRLKWNCNHGAFHGTLVAWESKSTMPSLVLTMERGMVEKRILFKLVRPWFYNQDITFNLSPCWWRSPQPIHTPKEVTTPFRRSRQTFWYLFTFQDTKTDKICFFGYRNNLCSL